MIRNIVAIAALLLSMVNSYFIFSGKDKKSEVATNQPQNTIINNTPNTVAPVPTEMTSQLNQGMNQNAGDKTPPAPSGPPTSLKFKKMEHDFGNVKQDSENKYEFEFTNTGKEPLVITDAKGSCGCTVPEYPKEPVAPGQKGKIKVVYSPGKQEGTQMKNVTITANTEPPQTVLTIKAEVKK